VVYRFYRGFTVCGNNMRQRESVRPRGPVPETEATIFKKKKLEENTKPAAKVRDYESHVLVCTGGDCKKRGAKNTRKALKEELRSEGILDQARIDTVDCLGLCKHGPNVVVYDGTEPKGTWYLGLREKDAPEIVERHLKDGEPVTRLAADRRPRRGKKAGK